MAPASLPQYTGWLGGAFGLIVGLVIFFKRFKGIVVGIVKFFVAVGQVADLDTRLLKVEKDQVNRTELNYTIDQMEGRVQQAQESNFSTMMRRLDTMEKRMEERIDGFLQLLNNANTDREILKALEDKKNAKTD